MDSWEQGRKLAQQQNKDGGGPAFDAADAEADADGGGRGVTGKVLLGRERMCVGTLNLNY
jgi:hypothetical protein